MEISRYIYTLDNRYIYWEGMLAELLVTPQGDGAGCPLCLGMGDQKLGGEIYNYLLPLAGGLAQTTNSSSFRINLVFDFILN